MKKILRFLIFYVSKPIFSSVLAAFEALFRGGRAEAIAEIKELRASCKTGRDLAAWYKRVGFAWTPDPWGGKVDFASKPWVSVARKKGDCEDMAAIAEYVLKGKYSEVRRAQTNVSLTKGHVIVIMRDDQGQWWMMSNQNFKGPYPDAEATVRSYYGDRTSFFYIY